MERVAAALAGVALLALIAAGGSGASHTPGGGPPFDLVVGSGAFPASSGDVSIPVNARETADGPTGFFTIHDADGDFAVEVSCLSVLGNTAVVGGEIVSGPPLYLGAGYLLLVIDNGGGTPDTVQIARVPEPPDPTFQCGLGGGQPSAGGNFIVHDS